MRHLTRVVGIDPADTLPLTVTRGCPLNCPHCGGHFLKHMVPVDQLEKYVNQHRSFLVSGGLTRDGRVPLNSSLDKLIDVKQRYGVLYNFHIGFPEVPPVELRDVADVISFEFFADPNVLKAIYGIWREPKQLLDSVINLGIPAVPHVTVGIMCGRITHEFEAIETLSRHFPYLVLNVFVPKEGTTFAGCQPPPVETVASLFRFAAERFETLVLGCMHPGGTYRKQLQDAVAPFSSAIVKPYNREHSFHGCCAFYVVGSASKLQSSL